MKRNRKWEIEAAAERRYQREAGQARAEYLRETKRIGKMYRDFTWPSCEMYEERMENVREEFESRIAEARIHLAAAYCAFWGMNGGEPAAGGEGESWRH